MEDRILFAVVALFCVLNLVVIADGVNSVRDCTLTGESRQGPVAMVYTGGASIPLWTLQHRYICPDGSDRWL
jgi:hypothetical protein